MKIPLFVVALILVLSPMLTMAHDVEVDPTKVGVTDGQQIQFVLDKYDNSQGKTTFQLPGVNNSLEVKSGTQFTLEIVNHTATYDNKTSQYWMSAKITIGDSTQSIALYFDEYSLVNFIDWAPYNASLDEEFQGSKAYYEGRGGKYSYNIWEKNNEFGFTFKLSLTQNDVTTTREGVTVFNYETGVLKYYSNSYMVKQGSNTTSENIVLRNPDYNYSTKSSSPVSIWYIFPIFAIPIIRRKLFRK